MTRGILYIVWQGDRNTPSLLPRSLESLKRFYPEMQCKVVELEDATLLDKSRMCDLSPFDSTLFLDADTVVMSNLDYGFEKAEQHGIACCICECPWARRYLGLRHKGDIEEFNTGVVFFTKDAKFVFDEWNRQSEFLNSASEFNSTPEEFEVMGINDQASFAGAIHKLNFNPWVLPLNWNYRTPWHETFFGEIKVWHSEEPVPQGLQEWVDNASHSDRVQCVKVRNPRREAVCA